MGQSPWTAGRPRPAWVRNQAKPDQGVGLRAKAPALQEPTRAPGEDAVQVRLETFQLGETVGEEAEEDGSVGGLGFGEFSAGALGVLLPGQDGLFDLEGIFEGDGDELAGDFDGVVMDGRGDAAQGVRGDPHEFSEVEVGSAELVEPPDELIGVGAAEAEGFAGALLALCRASFPDPGIAGGWVRPAERCPAGRRSSRKPLGSKRFFQVVLLKLKGFCRSNRLDPSGFLD